MAPNFSGTPHWAAVIRELTRELATVRPGFEFGVTFFASDLRSFPSTEGPGIATAETVAEAIAFVNSMRGGSGTCPHVGLLAALSFARRSSARPRAIIFVSDGGGTCSATAMPEWDYLPWVLDLIDAENTTRIPIHAIGIRVLPNGTREEFLRELARRNRASYTRASL